MRVFIAVQSSKPNSIKVELARVTAHVHQVSDSAEAADIIVTDSVCDAYRYLKKYGEAKVLIGLPYGNHRQDEESAAKALAKEYTGRVYTRPMFEANGEENLVHFLIKPKPFE